MTLVEPHEAVKLGKEKNMLVKMANTPRASLIEAHQCRFPGGISNETASQIDGEKGDTMKSAACRLSITFTIACKDAKTPASLSTFFVAVP